MKTLSLFISLLFLAESLTAQRHYSVANAHSHNDYEQKVPFYTAYNARFGSIEADIFLQNGELIVAHSQEELPLHRTLDSLYLQPLLHFVKENGGFAYPDTSRHLQMMIDIKTEAATTLQKLVQTLQQYPELIRTTSIKWTISGERPSPDSFSSYPPFIWFDGNISDAYSEAALSRIAMLSGNLADYTHWNGKSNLPKKEEETISALVNKAHDLHKPVRFWGAPDVVNAWYQLMRLGVDYLNTDHINELASFLSNLNKTSYRSTETHPAYIPSGVSDDSSQFPRNIILLIGDGCGLAEWYAGYTANKGALSVFNIKHTGLSKTSSADSYITDSAPGSTAFASGKKTNNRFVGVDATGYRVALIPEIIARKKMISGIITSGDITDATPADFYAHRSSRDSSDAILKDLAVSPLQFVMGAGNTSLPANVPLLQQHQFTVASLLKETPAKGKFIVADSLAGLSVLNGRKEWLSAAFDTAINKLSPSPNGFFLVLEAAQIDWGGHANNLPYIAAEVMDFDKVISRALQFADSNKKTLVIITADHETGGLSLLDGDITTGYVSGNFSTNDHTAIPVPVYAYGPQSQQFTGVYENIEVFYKMVKALQIPVDR